MNIQESGRSMVEMLGVLAIIGVISAGAISAVGYGMQSYRASWAYHLVEDTAQGVVDLYSWKREMETNASRMKSLICNNDIFDTACDSSDTTNASMKTPWGKFSIMPNDESSFQMQLTAVTENICNRLADMTWSENIAWTSPVSGGKPACNGTQTITFTVY